MYFPFLRGKKYELQTVSKLKDLILETGKITPIIEPVNLNSTTRRIISELNKAGVPLVFIVNPQVGDLVGQGLGILQPILNDIENQQIMTLGYFITENTTIAEIQLAMELFEDYSFAFIHNSNNLSIRDQLINIKNRVNFHIFIANKVSSTYQDAFRDKTRVIIKDCFNARNRNVDYNNDEYFSDLFSTYRTQYYGFGDFQIVGANISGGGPAHAVALHLTYLKELQGQEVWVRHFISDDTTTPANVQGKYFQALRKLVNFLDNYNHTPETAGAIQYRQNLADGVFHGLGYPKKLSMMHHFELMTQLI